jgi:hypothetical protein
MADVIANWLMSHIACGLAAAIVACVMVQFLPKAG